jgi:hypothetical protein
MPPSLPEYLRFEPDHPRRLTNDAGAAKATGTFDPHIGVVFDTTSDVCFVLQDKARISKKQPAVSQGSEEGDRPVSGRRVWAGGAACRSRLARQVGEHLANHRLRATRPDWNRVDVVRKRDDRRGQREAPTPRPGRIVEAE